MLDGSKNFSKKRIILSKEFHMKIIVGLGNPGVEYDRTPHNVGFLFVDRMARELDEFITFSEKSALGALCAMYKSPKSEDIFLIKPTVFMNNSGQVVRRILDYYHEPVTSLIVVHDDADLPVGTARFAYDRGAAGHNGVQSVIDHLGTKAFNRLRIGIDDGFARKSGLEKFVLTPMGQAFFEELKNGIDAGVKCISESFLSV